jgi:hypothetical protein
MTRVRVEAALALTAGGPVAWLGEAADGLRCCGLTSDVREGEATLSAAETLTPPAGAGSKEILEILAQWPAYRLVELAGVELGSGVLVLGEGWLADDILRHCGVRGCLWRAAPEPRRAGLVEHTLPSDGNLARARLPRPPDAVFVLGNTTSGTALALSVVRDRGVVVLANDAEAPIDLDLYPDVHRRGLRVVMASALAHSQAERELWPAQALRLLALVRAGRLRGE